NYRRLLASGNTENLPIPQPVRWRWSAQLAALALLPMLLSEAIVVIPSGSAGVRVSQISGTLPGTLYPGAHFVTPLVQQVAIYDTREMVFSTATSEEAKTGEKPETLQVQAKEGLPIGLAITVRYRLEAARLDYIHNNLPQPVSRELVQPTVSSIFRDLVPNYTVREVFASKREEIRGMAAKTITQKLGADGVEVEEVMLRDIQLPPEYAQGLEGLLLKEQEADRMGVETEIQQKQVRISELQAEAEKAQAIKHAEGDASVRVLQAKAEADAMQYTLPLKQKQIEQSRLEAEARKEATIKNAEGSAEAKVIDSKAEMQRRDLLAESEAKRIKIVAAADAERMRSEAAALRQNPLLINKIFAERLSDKIRIMMVPTDGKFFLGDMLKGSNPAGVVPEVAQPDEGEDPAAEANH
ncbi:MAG TPA: SPFH domain-containing protein, partial [Terriglobales bacterium]|nr:SPFH domain-containing protein [Terriglobales bacterium]